MVKFETKPHQYGEEKVQIFREWLMKRRPCYQDISTLEDGTVVGHVGALVCILNDEGNPVSLPFHRIVPTRKGYRAELGSDRFYLDGKGSLRGRIPAEISATVTTFYKTIYGIS